MTMRIAPEQIEAAAKELYIRALKNYRRISSAASMHSRRARPAPRPRAVLGTMIENIAVAERTDNLLCQDTGIPIYNVTIGRGVDIDGRH
jgi:fumarate hydratase subunit alpha/L(+)-tartrate dehydratase alpha subunit